MSYTITNNIMYVRNDTGELVPVSMIASGADQTIQAIKDTAATAESQIDTKVSDANTAIEAKTDEQVARIPEVTTLAEDVSGLRGEKLDKTPNTWPTWTADEKMQARANIGAGTSDFSGSYNDLSDKPIEETEDDAMEMLTEMGILDPIIDEEGNVLTDENGNVLTI